MMEPGGSLSPCPFCGGPAERLDLEDAENGSVISCTRCGASSAVHFDRKENLVSSWNDRAERPSSDSPEVQKLWDHTHALEAELASLKAERETFRRALEGAAILLNISEGEKQPYTSGYDSVHDAYNEVWHAWKLAERRPNAALHPAGSGEVKE